MISNDNSCCDEQGEDFPYIISLEKLANIASMPCADKRWTFAQYHIHDTYISSVSWRQDLWNWAMGQIGHSGWTLVDVVNALWNAGADAIAAVKAGVTKFIEGVKAAGEYLANSVIAVVLDLIVDSLKSIFEVFLIMLDNEIDQFSYIENPSNFVLDFNTYQLTLSIYHSNNMLYFGIEEFLFGMDLFKNELIETLALGEQDAKYDINFLFGSYITLMLSLTLNFLTSKGVTPLSKGLKIVSALSSLGGLIGVFYSVIGIIKNLRSLNDQNSYSNLMYDFIAAEYAGLSLTTMIIFTPTLLKKMSSLLKSVIKNPKSFFKSLPGVIGIGYGLLGYYALPVIGYNHITALNNNGYTDVSGNVAKLFGANALMSIVGIGLGNNKIVKLVNGMNSLLHYILFIVANRELGYIPNLTTPW